MLATLFLLTRSRGQSLPFTPLLTFISMTTSQKLTAEFIGTLWLVLGGCGSAVLAAAYPELGIGFVGVSLAFGLTVMTMAYAVGRISGGHFNPAVTVGLSVGGSFRPFADSTLHHSSGSRRTDRRRCSLLDCQRKTGL